VAVVTYFVWTATGIAFFPLLLVAMLFSVILKPLYRLLSIDISKWGRKEWIGTYLLFFFFWLGFTMLAFNPPFSDTAAPALEVAVNPQVQGVGGTVQIDALVLDNRDLVEQSVILCVHAGDPVASYDALSDSQRAACRLDWQPNPEADGVWSYTWSDTAGQEGTHQWFIQAEDAGGRVATANGTITIGDPFARIEPPRDDAFVVEDDKLTVRLADALPRESVRAVQYEIGGQTYSMEYDADNERWFTTSRHPGWERGANNLTVRAVAQDKWLGPDFKSVGLPLVQAGTSLVIDVDERAPIGGAEEPTYPADARPQRIASTPGPGLPVFLVGLAVAVVAVRRRQG
jgi:hypothetical protein